MPVELKAEIKGMKGALALVDGLATKMPEIEHFSIINAGEKARDAVIGEILGTFDRPTPKIIKSPRLSDTRGGPVGRRTIGKPLKLWFKDVFTDKSGESMIERTLRPHIEGGPRPPKPSEARLRRAGILKANEFLVPSRTAPLNRYGNIHPSEMTRILSDLRSFNEGGFIANRDLRKYGRDRYFIASPRGTRGIYKMVGRGGRDINLVFLIVKGAPRYRAIFDFYGVGQREFYRTINKEFDRVYQRELRKLR